MSGPSTVPMTPPSPTQPRLPTEVPEPTDALSDEQIQQTAEDILDTGDRVFADDYDSRAVRFGQEMAKLSPEDRARLVQELMNRDSGALNSWLKLDMVDRMQNEGRMTQQEYAAIAEGFVQACNNGSISQEQAESFLQIQSLTNAAPAIVDKQFQQMREFLAAAGNGPESQAFREELSESLLSRSLGDRGAWATHAPGLAMQIAADSGDPDMAARVFNNVLEANGGSDDTRSKLLDAIGQSSIGFQNSLGMDGLVNPLATLIDSVARQPNTTQWNDIAVAIARYAESSNDEIFYDPYTDKPLPELSKALSNLMSGEHGTAVLDALSEWNISGVPGRDGHAQRFGQNAIELGNLLRLTAFNPDNPDASKVMSTLQEWTQLRKDYLNGVERDDYPAGMSIAQAREQLGMLGGAAFDAAQQMKIDQDNRAAATQALVGFVVDLGLSVVPGGGKLSSLVAGDLKTAFGNNATVNRIIDQALSGGDTLSSAAIAQLKKDISGALSEDQVDLETLRTTASNFVSSAVVSGLSEGSQADGAQSHRDIVKTHVQNVQDDIQDNRK